MSEVIKKIDPKVAAIIGSNDTRGRAGSSLLAPLDLEDQLLEVMKWMRGSRVIDLPGGGRETVPRFGLLSLILQQTPIFVYGHPALKEISKTAFTDGMHIFLSDDLFDLLNDNVDDNPSTFGIEWVILHEVMHKLFNHVRRLNHFPPDIANEATDLSINTKLEEGYPDLPACPKLKETGLGFKPGDRERWMHLSEETIAMELMAMRGMKKERKKEADQGQQGNQGAQGQQGQPGGQGGQSGQQPGGQSGQQPGGQQSGGQGGQQQGGKGGQQQKRQAGDDPLADLDDPQGGGKPDGSNPGAGDPNGQGQGGGGQPDPNGQPQGGSGQGEKSDGPADAWGDPDDTHFISPADLIKVLEENGMEGVKDKLALPDSDDAESIGEMEEASRLRQAEAVMQAQSQMARIGGQYPGGHIVEAAGEMVANFGKAKVTWRMATQEAFLGGSTKFAPTMEEPNELFYVEEMQDVLGMQPYTSSMLPHTNDEAVLFLVDTSGSMSNEAMRVALTEAFELKTAAENAGDTAARVFIWPCDTVLRGEPIEINENNVDELLEKGVEMKGRGGTNIEECINQAMTHRLLADKDIRSIVYCSDLYDEPVPRPATLEDKPELKVVFLGDPKTPPSHVERFAKGTNWADVYVIEDGLEVDFDMVGEQAVSPTVRKRGMRM